jgi:DNA repair protein RecO (recombination protein O)
VPAPEHVYRTEAIVLRRHDLGEADRIVTLYTRDHGKIRAVAKGVRRPTSRHAGHVELFMRAEVLISRGRTLDILMQAETREAYQALRADLVRTTYASHFVELLDAFTEDNDQNPALYELLSDGLGWLCTTQNLRRTARYYELNLLQHAGYRPELFRCTVCRTAIKAENQFYSASEGGVICPRCGRDRPRVHAISLRALKVLRYLQTRPFEVVEQLKLGAAAQSECERVLFDTLSHHLERRLRSAAFLGRLRYEAMASGKQGLPDEEA